MPSQYFVSLVKKRETIITAFKLSYIALFLFMLVGTYSMFTDNAFFLFFFDAGKQLGKAAILLFILTLIPGIFRRFRQQHEIVALLMIFRRYIGILMYFTVVVHSLFVFGIDILKGFLPPFPPQLYIAMGSLATMGLTLMTLTSNDIATKKLGVWWNRIHHLTYTILWAIFLHVALREVSIWSILIGATGIVVVASHLYQKAKK